jgi:hypothetical protein
MRASTCEVRDVFERDEAVAEFLGGRLERGASTDLAVGGDGDVGQQD